MRIFRNPTTKSWDLAFDETADLLGGGGDQHQNEKYFLNFYEIGCVAELKHMTCHNISEPWIFYAKITICGIFASFKSPTMTTSLTLKKCFFCKPFSKCKAFRLYLLLRLPLRVLRNKGSA